MMIYCSQHKHVHRFTNTEAERLIYGLQADLADTEAYADGGQTGEDADAMKILHDMCPVDQIKNYRDGEMYQEHIETMINARKVVEHEDQLREAGHSVVKR